MIINKVSIQHFRSYGDDEFSLSFLPNTNTFIGENNVGKTTILEALKKIQNYESVWEDEDYHERNKSKEIRISFNCILDDDQIQKLIKIFDLPYDANYFRKYFADSLSCTCIKSPQNTVIKIHLGLLNIDNIVGYFGDNINEEQIHTYARWTDIVQCFKERSTELPKKVFEDFFVNFREQRNKNRLPVDSILGFDLPEKAVKKIIEVIYEKIIILEEFREKPQLKLNETLVSPTGRDLASVLFKLKVGTSHLRKKYRRIQSEFRDLFPNLDIEIIKEKEDYKIETQKQDIASTTQYIGSGIIQTLLLLTHVIAHSDVVLFIDTPEIQLHPHIQRRLGRILQSSQSCQIILITHSQYFIPISKESRLFRFIQVNGKTKAIYPEKGFTDSDYVSFDQILTIDNKEFFFSRFVLLVEGLSDQWVIQLFSSSKGFDLDRHGISVISVNGKSSFTKYPKILESYQIPWMVMADRDKKGEIEKIFQELSEKYPSAQRFVLSGEIEHVLNRDFVIEGKRLFGEGNDKKNKPIIARYAAAKMIENNMKIPKDIENVILALQKISKGSI